MSIIARARFVAELRCARVRLRAPRGLLLVFGELRGGDPLPLAISSWSIVHGLSMLLSDQLLSHAGVWQEDVRVTAERVVSVLFDGLRAR